MTSLMLCSFKTFLYTVFDPLFSAAKTLDMFFVKKEVFSDVQSDTVVPAASSTADLCLKLDLYSGK